MKSLWTVVLGFTLVTVTSPMSASAQATTVTSTDSIDYLAFSSISKLVRASSELRVYTTASRTSPLALHGSDLGPSGFRGALGVDPPGEAKEGQGLAWAEVQTVQVKGNAMKEGATLASILCAAGAVAAVVAWSYSGEFFHSSSDGYPAQVVGGTIGVVILGAAIGSRIPKWHTVYGVKR